LHYFQKSATDTDASPANVHTTFFNKIDSAIISKIDKKTSIWKKKRMLFE